MDAADNASGRGPRLEFDTSWDSPTAVTVLVLGALAFLWFVRRGFRGLVVSVGS